MLTVNDVHILASVHFFFNGGGLSLHPHPFLCHCDHLGFVGVERTNG